MRKCNEEEGERQMGLTELVGACGGGFTLLHSKHACNWMRHEPGSLSTPRLQAGLKPD